MEREENELLDTAEDVKGFLKSSKYHRDIPKYIERTNIVRGTALPNSFHCPISPFLILYLQCTHQNHIYHPL